MVEFNEGARRITGYTREEMTGQNWFEVICPQDRFPDVWAEFNRLGAGGFPTTFENPILTKFGEERHILWANTRWKDEAGVIRMIAVGIDMTEKQFADRALAESVALLESIVEGAPSAIFAKNLAHEYVLMNDRGASLLNMPLETVVGHTDAELFGPKLAEEFAAGDRKVTETMSPYSYNEEGTPTSDGAWRYRLITKGPVLNQQGQLAGVFGIASDLTEPIAAAKTIAKAARESEHLAGAATALIGCPDEECVFDLIVDFFAEVVPDALVIVNQSTNGGQYFRTRHITGADTSLLMKAARLIGFEVIGRKFLITDEYRRRFFTSTLTKVPGGFGTLAASEVPRPLIRVLESTFSLHDTYTIGIVSDGSEFGSVHILTRVPNAEVPERIIDAFIRQCVLALFAIKRAHEVAEYQERLESLLIEREQHVESLGVALTSVINVVSRTVEMRDPYTAGHQKRVAQLATRIAQHMGLAECEIEDIRTAALMHDVGKVSVPAEILSKPGHLSQSEFAVAMYHALAGYEIVKAANMHGPIAEIIYQHHERCNGSGYPRGLSSTDLHVGAKVIMVADVVEAMASHRPYRAALGIEEALAEIESGVGVLYDPDVVAACVQVMRDGFEFDYAEDGVDEVHAGPLR